MNGLGSNSYATNEHSVAQETAEKAKLYAALMQVHSALQRLQQAKPQPGARTAEHQPK